MSTDSRKKRRALVLLTPLLTALPVIAVLAVFSLRYGLIVHKLINIAIKMTVIA